MNHVTHNLSSTDISIFSLEISKFCYIKKYRYRLHFGTEFLTFLTFIDSEKGFKKDFFNKTGYNFDEIITVFWNKGYDVIIPVDDVTNKILSRDSNYIVDVSMWPNFGNCSISLRQVITTSIL